MHLLQEARSFLDKSRLSSFSDDALQLAQSKLRQYLKHYRINGKAIHEDILSATAILTQVSNSCAMRFFLVETLWTMRKFELAEMDGLYNTGNRKAAAAGCRISCSKPLKICQYP